MLVNDLLAKVLSKLGEARISESRREAHHRRLADADAAGELVGGRKGHREWFVAEERGDRRVVAREACLGGIKPAKDVTHNNCRNISGPHLAASVAVHGRLLHTVPLGLLAAGPMNQTIRLGPAARLTW